jgi:hypothetical protein
MKNNDKDKDNGEAKKDAKKGTKKDAKKDAKKEAKKEQKEQEKKERAMLEWAKKDKAKQELATKESAASDASKKDLAKKAPPTSMQEKNMPPKGMSTPDSRKSTPAKALVTPTVPNKPEGWLPSKPLSNTASKAKHLPAGSNLADLVDVVKAASEKSTKKKKKAKANISAAHNPQSNTKFFDRAIEKARLLKAHEPSSQAQAPHSAPAVLLDLTNPLPVDVSLSAPPTAEGNVEETPASHSADAEPGEIRGHDNGNDVVSVNSRDQENDDQRSSSSSASEESNEDDGEDEREDEDVDECFGDDSRDLGDLSPNRSDRETTSVND